MGCRLRQLRVHRIRMDSSEAHFDKKWFKWFVCTRTLALSWLSDQLKKSLHIHIEMVTLYFGLANDATNTPLVSPLHLSSLEIGKHDYFNHFRCRSGWGVK